MVFEQNFFTFEHGCYVDRVDIRNSTSMIFEYAECPFYKGVRKSAVISNTSLPQNKLQK